MFRGRSYDNRQYGWDTTSPAYEAPQPHNVHLVFEDSRIMIEEERPVASYYPERVSVPVHKKHHPRKHVHFVEHKEKVAPESFDSFGSQKVYKENVDNAADGFIKRKHMNFELSKTNTFNSFNY